MNNEKYTVKEFIKFYKEEKDIVKTYTKYFSYVKKVAICEKIVKKAYYQLDNVTNTQKFHITSTIDYVLFKMSLIDIYTNIKVDFKNVMDEYDLLCENDLLEVITRYIPKKEFEEFETILQMTKDDYMKNEYHAGAYVANRIQDISLSLGATLSPILEALSKNLEDIDESKIKVLANTLNNNPIIRKILKK